MYIWQYDHAEQQCCDFLHNILLIQNRLIDGRVSCPVALRLDDVEIQLECRHAVAKRLEQRRITLFNGDEFFDILLVSARYGKDPESGGVESVRSASSERASL